MAFRVTELVGGEGANFGISQEESACEVTYHLDSDTENQAPTVAQLSGWVDSVLGGVANLEPRVVNRGAAGAGKIVRALPLVHPWRPEMSAAAIVSLAHATEQHDPANATTVFGLTPMKTSYPNALAYRARVKFSKRPYFLLPDEKIELERRVYYNPDGSEVPVYCAQEWRRFTRVNRKPRGDFATASTGGAMKFRTQGGSAPDTEQSTAIATMYLQNSDVEVEWFNVPYRYTLDYQNQKSYLNRFVGTVNQTEIMGFLPGSLLYQGYEVTSQYIPVTPKRQKLLNALALGLDQSLLCNLKLKFIHTSREGADVPNSGSVLLTNRNNVAAGHNLFPHYTTRQFYYSVSEAVGGDAYRRPAFDSFEFGLFFTDPCLQQDSTI